MGIQEEKLKVNQNAKEWMPQARFVGNQHQGLGGLKALRQIGMSSHHRDHIGLQVCKGIFMALEPGLDILIQPPLFLLTHQTGLVILQMWP